VLRHLKIFLIRLFTFFLLSEIMKGLLPLVVLLFAALILINARFSPETNSVDTRGYMIGEQAEDFTLKNYDGRLVSLSSYPDAKGFILVFTSNHCPYAEAYEDRLVGLHQQYAALGYPLIAINPNAPEANPDDNAQANALKAKTKKFPFPYLSDSLQQVFPRFGATRTPHVFVLDSNRIVKYIGTIDDNAEAPRRVKKRYVEDAINTMLSGGEPYPTITKTVGCKIRLIPRDSVTGRIREDD
jgi:peroxiredoxin